VTAETFILAESTDSRKRSSRQCEYFRRNTIG
jgi:hypothetical protein